MSASLDGALRQGQALRAVAGLALARDTIINTVKHRLHMDVYCKGALNRSIIYLQKAHLYRLDAGRGYDKDYYVRDYRIIWNTLVAPK